MLRRRMTTCVAVGFVLAFGVVACERSPSGITCNKLRSLRVGMPIEQVRQLLGSPPRELEQDGHIAFGGPRDTDVTWNWPSATNGERLYVYFGHGRLLS